MLKAEIESRRSNTVHTLSIPSPDFREAVPGGYVHRGYGLIVIAGDGRE